MNDTIKVGDAVRSYDFDGRTDCYVEGVVVAIKMPHGMDAVKRYEIKVARQVFGGDEIADHADFVYPPINGTPTLFGRECNGVVLADAEPEVAEPELPQLNENQRIVFTAICENILDCTDGSFGFADEIHRYCYTVIERRALPGICASLKRRGLYTSSPDKFRQTTLTKLGKRFAAQLGFETDFATIG